MLWLGIFLCGVSGIQVGAFVADFMLSSGAGGDSSVLFTIGTELFPFTGLAGAGAISLARKRAKRVVEAPEETLATLEPVLARVEAATAVGEGPDIPLQLLLTVAPDGLPGYRVQTRATINLMDIDRYKVGRLIVARYDPYFPWRVEIPPSYEVPGEWTVRASTAAIDSAPLDSLVVRPDPSAAAGTKLPLRYQMGQYVGLLAALASLAVFWK
jgi:hypothetical protein